MIANIAPWILQLAQEAPVIDWGAILMGLAALVTAAAALMKSIKSGEDLDELKERVKSLEAENIKLKAQVADLTKENDELRDQNKTLAAINEEYRTKILNHRRSGD